MKPQTLYFFKYPIILVVIFLLQACSDGYYTNPPTENFGKVNVYIENDITDAEAQAKLKADVGTLTENIYVQNTTNLTALKINLVATIRKLTFTNNENIQTINVSGTGDLPVTSLLLGSKNIATINITGIKSLQDLKINGAENGATSINCNSIETILNEFNFVCNSISNNRIVFKNLKYVSSNNPNNSFEWYGKFTVFDFPVLEEINAVIYPYININNLDLPKLKKIKGFNAGYYGDTQFKNLNLPELENCEFFSIRQDNFPKPTVNIPMLNYCKYYNSKIGLTSSGINSILHKFLAIQPLSGKNLNFIDEYVSPTGQGLIDKATLIGQGNTVTTN